MFWDLMRAEFGEAYAESVAKDYVLSGLGDRTVNKALADGEDAKVIWRAVCDTFNIPESLRYKSRTRHLERSVGSTPAATVSRSRPGHAAGRFASARSNESACLAHARTTVPL